MASAPRSSGGLPRDTREPAGDGVVWHSTCGYAGCVEPSRYAADSTCKGCRRIKYCTRECQKADWKRHKPACKADAAADEAAAREGALVARPRARPPPPEPMLLLKAALDGNLKHVEALLRLGADVNAADKNGFTPLYVASLKGHVAIVAALLAAPGIDVNAVGWAGCTYVLPKSSSSIRLFNAVTTDCSTPLAIASKVGNLAVVSALLAAPGVFANAAQEDGFTSLHYASGCGRVEVVSALLAHPTVIVNPRSTREWAGCPSGSTPLRLARDEGHLGIVALLEARGGVV